MSGRRGAGAPRGPPRPAARDDGRGRSRLRPFRAVASPRPTAGGRFRASRGRGLLERSRSARPGTPLAGLVQNLVAELVAGPGEREGRVRVEALELAGSACRRSRRRAPAGARAAPGRRARGSPAGANPRRRRATSARLRRRPRPGDRRREPGTGQVVGGRERLSVRAERRLLRNRGIAVRAADRHPPKRASGPPKLPGDHRPVVHQIIVTGPHPVWRSLPAPAAPASTPRSP